MVKLLVWTHTFLLRCFWFLHSFINLNHSKVFELTHQFYDVIVLTSCGFLFFLTYTITFHYYNFLIIFILYKPLLTYIPLNLYSKFSKSIFYISYIFLTYVTISPRGSCCRTYQVALTNSQLNYVHATNLLLPLSWIAMKKVELEALILKMINIQYI